MKNLIIIMTAACLLYACAETPSTHVGDPIVSDNVTVTLTENLTDKNVSALVELTAGPEGYAKALLKIGDDKIGYFAGGKLNFQPSEFGDVDCSIVYYDAAGAVIETREDTLGLRIETWFLSVQTDVGYVPTQLENTDTKLMYTAARAIGNDDLCWMYEIRVPYDETLKFTASVESGDLAVHFRLIDYAGRNSLYTLPDEALYHIDAETDKWISSPYEIGHGVHRLYVAPNALCALSLLKIVHVSDGISGNVTGYVKPLVF